MRIEPLHVADVTLPEGHPLAGEPCAVYAFLISHPDGAIVVDTGVGAGHDGIERLYRPERRSLRDALTMHGLRQGDIAALINTHLHFDHCGENRLFPGLPIYVQSSEYAAANDPLYSIRDWIDFPGATYELLDGETEVRSGVTVVPTPGHTPGHQSVLIDNDGEDDGSALIAGQAVYSAAEFAGATPPASGADDQAQYLASLERLRGLDAQCVYFSHDPAVWRPPVHEAATPRRNDE